jgi:uncharacterized membrane protein YbhN (UPF0104 family)
MATDDAIASRLARLRELLARVRPYGAAIGALLLVAAIARVSVGSDLFSASWSALTAASGLVVAALIGAMVASVLLTGMTFWFLTRRFGRIGVLEMQALMAATALANYLPLRPGLLGRVVYHSSRNAIRPRDSIRTIAEAMGLSVLALGVLVPSLLVGHRLGLSPVPAAIVPVGLALLVSVPALAVRTSRPLAWAFLTRFAETLLTALRYDIAFRLVGSPLPWHVAAAIACVSMVATMVPFVSNGLGLREWAIGLLAPLLAGISLERGLAAELLNRAIEVAVIVPSGSLGFFWLWKRSRVAAKIDD